MWLREAPRWQRAAVEAAVEADVETAVEAQAVEVEAEAVEEVALEAEALRRWRAARTPSSLTLRITRIGSAVALLRQPPPPTLT